MNGLIRFADKHFPPLVVACVALTSLVLIAVALVGAFYAKTMIQEATLAAVRAPAPPALEYTQPVFTPVEQTLCPSSPLVYTPVFKVAVTGALTKQQGWWDRTTNKPALTRGGAPIPVLVLPTTPLPPSTDGKIRSPEQRVLVPDLAAGEYWLSVAVFDPAGRQGQAKYVVPVTVPEGCP